MKAKIYFGEGVCVCMWSFWPRRKGEGEVNRILHFLKDIHNFHLGRPALIALIGPFHDGCPCVGLNWADLPELEKVRSWEISAPYVAEGQMGAAVVLIWWTLSSACPSWSGGALEVTWARGTSQGSRKEPSREAAQSWKQTTPSGPEPVQKVQLHTPRTEPDKKPCLSPIFSEPAWLPSLGSQFSAFKKFTLTGPSHQEAYTGLSPLHHRVDRRSKKESQPHSD